MQGKTRGKQTETDSKRKSVYFVSLGCPKNRVDSEVMVGVARSSGYEVVADAEEAETIVINTCGFIGEAKKESIDTILEMSELKKHGHLERLVVTGCLSQRYPTELSSQMPEVDHFLGSSDMLKLGDVLRGGAERMLVGHPADWVISAKDPRVLTGNRVHAYVKIAEGCNRVCSFCTIPEFRGKQRSRTIDDVVREVEQLAAQGVVEINLISQDTIAYGRDLSKESRGSLAALARRVADVEGIRWVRLFYLYPETINEELIELLGQHPRVVPYVDMPLQHAADAMLRRMKRGHGANRQRRVVERMRKEIPGLTFRTAFIVGHPGETDEEFQELCDFVTWAEFDHVGVFRYSDEESCKSFGFDDKVTARVASSRYRKLMSLQRRIARKANKARIGQELDVLVEGQSEEHDFVMAGRHAGQAPEIDGQVYLSGAEVLAGQIRRVRISQASDYDLVGDVIDEESFTAAPAPKKKKRIALKMFDAPASIASPTTEWR
ncbi:30S ribosomal protein S12 methylthiotransferase RimO [Pendulispora rubella]|uniref:30S ribosomal protein S12 methylthiotransferase RimO n=1 Tax=Pendulispora rubella TaxID=2741070 RepID=UPI00374E13F2